MQEKRGGSPERSSHIQKLRDSSRKRRKNQKKQMSVRYLHLIQKCHHTPRGRENERAYRLISSNSIRRRLCLVLPQRHRIINRGRRGTKITERTEGLLRAQSLLAAGRASQHDNRRVSYITSPFPRCSKSLESHMARKSIENKQHR